jgi:diacylglycerol kinase (ATP)
MTAGVTVVLNPAAGRGRGAKAKAGVAAAFAAHGMRDLRESAGPGDEYAVARKAIEDGSTTLVAVGGDGTWSQVGSAILDSGRTCRLALISAGTGNDFARTLRVPAGDYDATARLVANGSETAVDVGRIEDHWFLNIAGFGFDIAVLDDIGKIPFLQGELLYKVSALRQIIGFKGVEIGISSPARRRESERHLMLIVANARYFGGAFHIAPKASLTDGVLDAIAIRDAAPLGRMRLFNAAPSGRHVEHSEVEVEQAASFTLRFASPPAYETDGEYRRAKTAELEIRCVPRALRVVTGANGS